MLGVPSESYCVKEQVPVATIDAVGRVEKVLLSLLATGIVY